MQFDVFHSIGRIDTLRPVLSDRQAVESFFGQAELAESCGYGTVWVAESHFSSEVQKRHRQPVIPNYQGEVGLNCDSVQMAQALFARTRRIGFGTAIFNIVGGNGGPIGAADRINMLAFLNSLSDHPRRLDIGFAAGRFPYINSPFGIVPRNDTEQSLWSQVRSTIFLEAAEIFLRLLNGGTLSSEQLVRHTVGEGIALAPRWTFEPLKLVPVLDAAARCHVNFILGSHDPAARKLAFSLADCDIFNLSFTPVEKINAVHAEMTLACAGRMRPWHRSRMPRTVMVFIDDSNAKAQERASRCFDTYIEAMRGTAEVPDKDVLMSRALIGDSGRISELLSPDCSLGFQRDDRLMLWFEFNQNDGESVKRQMRTFADKVMPKFA